MGVNRPVRARVRQVPINVEEGSWMDVDVSPDGRRVAFTLLGDIYTMPIEGRPATRIAEGLAGKSTRAFRPTGRASLSLGTAAGATISGYERQWQRQAQVTKEDFRLLNSRRGAPTGGSYVAKKHCHTGRSLGTGGSGCTMCRAVGGVCCWFKRESEKHQKELGEPVYSPDGKGHLLHPQRDSGPDLPIRPGFEHQPVHIERYDLATGEVTAAVSGPGGSVRLPLARRQK